MADHHSLDPHLDLLSAFRTYLHRRGDPKVEARLETAKRFLEGRNGSNGPVSAEEVTGYLEALSPSFRADLKRFGAFLAEGDRRRPDPAEGLERRIEELPPPAREPLQAYFHWLRRRNFALNTLRCYVGALRGFALALPGVSESGWASVSREDVGRFIEAEQARSRRASTINVKLKVLHGFYEFLIEQGLAAPNPVRKGAYLKMPEALPKPMAAEDTRRFVQALEGVRDRAIFLVLLRTGMRVGELLAARVQEVDLAESSFTIPKGKKNRRGRVVYLSAEAHGALSAWLADRRGEPTEPLFPGRWGRPLSYQAVRRRFKAALARAGIARSYGLHSLRHTFATEMLNAGLRLEVLQRLLGHDDLSQTQRYARLSAPRQKEEYFHHIALVESRRDLYGELDPSVPEISRKAQCIAQHLEELHRSP